MVYSEETGTEIILPVNKLQSYSLISLLSYVHRLCFFVLINHLVLFLTSRRVIK